MEDYAEEMFVDQFLIHIFGRVFSDVLGILPVLMLLVLCVIYAPIIVTMLRSAWNPDQTPP